MTTGDLTTLASVETLLSLASGNSDEPVLSQLITAASDFVTEYCGRSFLSASYTETRNGTGGRAMALKAMPITAVSSLVIGPDTVPASSGWGSPGYFFSGSMLMLRGGYRFERALGNVVIAYTAGFAAVPPALQQAVNELVMLRFKERKHFDQSSVARTAGETTTFVVKDMKESTRTMLDRYKRVVPGWP